MNAPLTRELNRIDYRTEPGLYRHWRLSVEGAVATLAMNVDENAGLRPGYQLKLNSYDLGVDIELHDALNRVRFEHPVVRTVVITSLKERIFCSGANIFMLGVSGHAWKVNFCKFTNRPATGSRTAVSTLASSSLPRSMGPARAGPTSSRWPATRSCWSTIPPHRSPCLRCPCWACCPAPGG